MKNKEIDNLNLNESVSELPHDSDSVIAKRLRNVFLYQLDRTHKDLVTFVPVPGMGGYQQMYQLFKSPIASITTIADSSYGLV